jgi:hypothetical protein
MSVNVVVASLICMLATLVSTTFLSLSRGGASPGAAATSSPMETWPVPSIARVHHVEEAVETVERRSPSRVAGASASRLTQGESTDVAIEEVAGDGAISGWVIWADGHPTDRVKLVLKGAPETPHAHLEWVARTDAHGRFDFTGIPAWSYMLTNRLWGAPTWRLQVSVRAGESVTLDLGEANAAAVRDDFPDA